jgi:hypothetical protein
MDTDTKASIIHDLGIDGLKEEEQQEVLQRIGSIIYQAVFERILGELSEEDQDKLDRMLGKDPAANEVLTFLRERVDNVDEIIAEEVQRFRETSTQVMNEIDTRSADEASTDAPAEKQQESNTADAEAEK